MVYKYNVWCHAPPQQAPTMGKGKLMCFNNSHEYLTKAVQIQPALPHLATMLFTNDETIVCHTLAALSLILPGINVEFNVPRRMVELLTYVILNTHKAHHL